MVGEGTNDQIAMKFSDVSIALGISGTAVTKNVAGFILEDDNISNILLCIKEARTIYCNYRSYFNYMIASKLQLLTLMYINRMAQLPLITTPVQLLWLTILIGAGPPQLLALTKSPSGIMERKPFKR